MSALPSNPKPSADGICTNVVTTVRNAYSARPSRIAARSAPNTGRWRISRRSTSGCVVASCRRTQPAEHHGGRRRTARARRRGPPPRAALPDAEQQHDQARRDHHGAADVQRRPDRAGAARDDAQRRGDGQAADHGARQERVVHAQPARDQPAERIADADARRGADRQQPDHARDPVGGSRSRATAIVTGATPSPTPCIARPATSTPIESAQPAMMLPTNTTASAPGSPRAGAARRPAARAPAPRWSPRAAPPSATIARRRATRPATAPPPATAARRGC